MSIFEGTNLVELFIFFIILGIVTMCCVLPVGGKFVEWWQENPGKWLKTDHRDYQKYCNNIGFRLNKSGQLEVTNHNDFNVGFTNVWSLKEDGTREQIKGSLNAGGTNKVSQGWYLGPATKYDTLKEVQLIEIYNAAKDRYYPCNKIISFTH